MAAYNFTSCQITWIKAYFEKCTHKELYDHLVPDGAVKYTTFRTALYDNGFKRFNKFIWTAQEVKCLKTNLNTMGNKELAAHITATCGRKIKEKQIDKKLQLLGLTRTDEGFAYLRDKYKRQGIYSRANYLRWKNKSSPDGETRIWKRSSGNPIKVIKVNGRWIHSSPHYWRLKYGTISPGHVIWHIDGDATNSHPDCLNLELITRQEVQLRLAAMIANRPESLKQAIKLTNKLTKILNHEK